MSEYAAELAVHLTAASQQADAAALCDSAAFMARVAALGPDTPGFVQRVAAAVREAVTEQPTYRLGDAPAPQAGQGTAQVPPSGPPSRQDQQGHRAALTAEYDGEITVADVQLADPHVVAAWAASGKLAALGFPARRRRR